MGSTGSTAVAPDSRQRREAVLSYQARGRGDVDEMLGQRAAWVDRQAKEFGVDANLIRAVVKYKSLGMEFRPTRAPSTYPSVGNREGDDEKQRMAAEPMGKAIRTAAVWLNAAKDSLRSNGADDPSNEQILSQYIAQQRSEDPRQVRRVLGDIYRHFVSVEKSEATRRSDDNAQPGRGLGFVTQVPSGSWRAPTASHAEMAENSREYFRQVGEVFKGYGDVTIGAAKSAYEAVKDVPQNLAELRTTIGEQAKMEPSTLLPTLKGAVSESGKQAVDGAKEFGERLYEGDNRAWGQGVGSLLAMALPVKGVGALVRVESKLAKAAKGTPKKENLVHLTDAVGEAGINSEKLLKGKHGIFAVPAKVASEGWKKKVGRTGLKRSKTEKVVEIPEATLSNFRRPIPIGLYSGWKYLGNVRYAPSGSINLKTGAFTRSASLLGPKTLIYGPDVFINSTGAGLGGYYLYKRSRSDD